MSTLEIILALLTAVGIILGGVWFMLKKSFDNGINSGKLITVEEKVEKLPCDARLERIHKLEANISILELMKVDISLMKNKLIPDTLTATHSPISLTEAGKVVAEEIKIKEAVDANKDNILKYIDENSESMNAYDIQQLCIETASIALDRFFLNEDIDRIKTHAFQNGNPLSVYGRLIGVLIRDIYFDERKIDIEEVDKHDPLKKKTE